MLSQQEGRDWNAWLLMMPSSSRACLVGVDHLCCKGCGCLHKDLTIELHLMLVQVVLHVGRDGLCVCCTATSAYKNLQRHDITQHCMVILIEEVLSLK